MGSETDEIIEGIFKSLLQRYQEGLEGFDSVNSLYYKLHKISINKRGSYIDFPKW